MKKRHLGHGLNLNISLRVKEKGVETFISLSLGIVIRLVPVVKAGHLEKN